MDKPRILIVEDDPSNVRGTIALLENKGVLVDIATSVEDAVYALKRKSYALMLVDWTLPLSAGGPSDSDAGGKLIARVTSGKAGRNSREIPYFVITKQTDQFGAEQTTSDCALGILSKLDALTIVDRVVHTLFHGGTTQ